MSSDRHVVRTCRHAGEVLHQLNARGRGLLTGGAGAYLGVRNGQITIPLLLQALQDHLLQPAQDERTDIRIGHTIPVHRSDRPSPLTRPRVPP